MGRRGYDIDKVNRMKYKMFDRMDEEAEYEGFLKKVKKDIQRFPMGRIRRKYSTQVIKDATKEEVTT